MRARGKRVGMREKINDHRASMQARGKRLGVLLPFVQAKRKAYFEETGRKSSQKCECIVFYGFAIPHGARARATNPNEETEPVANCLNGDGMEALAAMVKSLHALLAPDRNQRAVKSVYAVLEHA
jgi:hypothetical protein